MVLLDEVQECPRVRSAIKFLVEDGRFDYIESSGREKRNLFKLFKNDTGFYVRRVWKTYSLRF